jgi:hypothetical protein
MGNIIRMVPSDGGPAVDVPEEDAQVFSDRGYVAQGNERRAAATVESARDDYYSSPQAKVAAGGLALGRVVTGGLSDAAIRAFGSDDDRATAAALREHNSKLSTGIEIGGALLPGGVASLASKAGKLAGSKTVLGAARGAATEGFILGTGQGISEVSLSEKPVDIERAASVIGSNALFGGFTGGAIGLTGKLAEKGLRAAKGKLDDIAAKGMASDVAQAEGRKALASDITALRTEMKANKIWLATKDADVKAIKEVREVGKIALDADRMIDRSLRNPKVLAKRPEKVLDALQQQEHALETLIGQGDNLRPIFAKDASGARQAAFDYASVALEKNRALQEKIATFTAKAAKPAAKGIGDVVADAGLGYAVGAAAGVPILGQAIALGRIGAGLVKKLGVDTSAAAARGSQAIQTFLNVGTKVAAPARVVATKVLSQAAYGATVGKSDTKKQSGTAKLAAAYKARSSEIRNLTEPGPDGNPVMRADARAKVAEQLKPIAAVQPLLADKIESNKALAIEYLARMQPKMPDLPGMDPDMWQPSDIEMRTWARRVAGVEDPHGIVERLASGEVTPEDRETMSEVYPEMYAQIQSEIMQQMGELRAKLPYQRRLALSIFSGVAVDPTLDPRVLAALQGSFTEEPGTDGGIQAPRAQPAFGSVSKPQPTPAQQRGGM